jgi:hypothetical protein
MAFLTCTDPRKDIATWREMTCQEAYIHWENESKRPTEVDQQTRLHRTMGFRDYLGDADNTEVPGMPENNPKPRRLTGNCEGSIQRATSVTCRPPNVERLQMSMTPMLKPKRELEWEEINPEKRRDKVQSCAACTLYPGGDRGVTRATSTGRSHQSYAPRAMKGRAVIIPHGACNRPWIVFACVLYQHLCPPGVPPQRTEQAVWFGLGNGEAGHKRRRLVIPFHIVPPHRPSLSWLLESRSKLIKWLEWRSTRAAFLWGSLKSQPTHYFFHALAKPPSAPSRVCTNKQTWALDSQEFKWIKRHYLAGLPGWIGRSGYSRNVKEGGGNAARAIFIS